MDPKFLLEDLEKVFVNAVLDFQTDRLTPLSALQLFLNLHQKIGCLILLDGEVGITHDTVWIGTQYLVIHKQPVYVSLNDLF